MLRILVADDHTVVRRGLRQILLEGFPGAAIEEVADAEDLVKQVMKLVKTHSLLLLSSMVQYKVLLKLL